MRLNKHLWLLCWSILLCLATYGQNKDTLDVINIHENFLFNQPNSIQLMDSLDRYSLQVHGLHELLNQNSNVTVKNYGLSNLSTLSIRGSSAAQTNVEWNGISIQNAMLGLTDLSILPTYFFNDIRIQYGSFTGGANTQAIGGSLLLGSNSKFNEQTLLEGNAFAQYESFKNIKVGGGLDYTTPKLSLGMKLLLNKGENSYTYFDSYAEKLKRIEHAKNQQVQLLLDAAYRLNNKSRLETHIWYIHNQREIPPTIFESSSQKEEANKVFRSALNYNYFANSFWLKVTAGVSKDSLSYSDSFIRLQSDASILSAPIHFKMGYRLGRTQYLGFNANIISATMQTPMRENKLDRYWFTLNYELEPLLKHFVFSAFLNKEYSSIFKVPFTYGVSCHTNIRQQLLLFTKYSTNYRTPSLNELFYFPGGNELLKPEYSTNYELGGKYVKDFNWIKLESEISAYTRMVKDWISWNGSAIFFPNNIAQVWSRGFEQQSKVTFNTQRINFTSQFLYAYTLATTQETLFTNDPSIGKQIPYVPRYSYRLNQTLAYKKIIFQFHHAYVGYRFTTTDESIFITPYHITSLNMEYKWTKNLTEIHGSVRLNNVFNANYESLRGRIMPGRNLVIGCSVKGVL